LFDDLVGLKKILAANAVNL
jgi:hypothetical protein